MTVKPRPEEVRRWVASTFCELGANLTVGRDLDETILISEGKYVARSYRVEGFSAMWLVAMGLLQFYDDEGTMLRTVNLFDRLTPQRLAA